jgi:hypothetical protein
MTFPSTSHHPALLAGADRTASGQPFSDTRRRPVITVRPLRRPAGVLRRRVVAVAAATVLARDTVHSQAPESRATAPRRPAIVQSRPHPSVAGGWPDGHLNTVIGYGGDESLGPVVRAPVRVTPGGYAVVTSAHTASLGLSHSFANARSDASLIESR